MQGLDQLENDAYSFVIKAAGLYRSLRKRGGEINKVSAYLIARLCVNYNFSLFHNDKDFDNIAKHTSLKIYTY